MTSIGPSRLSFYWYCAMTVSEHGVVLYANPQVASFLGVERGSMAGRDIADYVSVDQLPTLTTLLASGDQPTGARS